MQQQSAAGSTAMSAKLALFIVEQTKICQAETIMHVFSYADPLQLDRCWLILLYQLSCICINAMQAMLRQVTAV